MGESGEIVNGEYMAGRVGSNRFSRTFYISPAKFTSFTVQNCVQQG